MKLYNNIIRCSEKAGPSGTVRNPLKRILEPTPAATNGLSSLTAPESMEMDTDSPTNTTSSSVILNGNKIFCLNVFIAVFSNRILKRSNINTVLLHLIFM